MGRAVAASIVGTVLLTIIAGLSGCCVRPSSPWDQTVLTERTAIPGVVAIFDHALGVAMCTGTVIKNEPTNSGFAAFVLTAKHCAPDLDHPHRWGVSIPAAGDIVSLMGSHVLDATLMYTSPNDDAMWGVGLFRGSVDWLDNDWAILRVNTPTPLPIVPVFSGDPMYAIPPGAMVTIAAYHDIAYSEREATFLRPHEHPFAWTGVPAAVAQGGHSGAPLLWNGEVVGVFSGFDSNSYACRCVTGRTWPTRLRFVSVATIRKQASTQGFSFESAEPISL
jgi:hypothetical protein